MAETLVITEQPKYKLTVIDGKTLTLGYTTGNITLTGVTNPMSVAADLIVGGASGNPTRLAKGTARQLLAMNSSATAQVWTSADPIFSTNTVVGRDGYGMSQFGSIELCDDITGNVKARLLPTPGNSERDYAFEDDDGTIALRDRPRAQLYFQGNSSTMSITTSYQKVSIATTLDSASNIGFANPTAGTLEYETGETRFFNIIGTIDVENTTGGHFEVSIKIAKNGTPIDATQCNATIPNNGVGKLHSMWMLELAASDTIEIHLAKATGSATVIPVRMRVQAVPVL